MELFHLRVASTKPNIVRIFGLGYYKSLETGEDAYSKKIMYFYKYGNDIQFFSDKIRELYQLRFEGDLVKFDYITLYPSHSKDTLNENMVSLAKMLPLSYHQVLRRNKTIRYNHECKTFAERVDNVKGSIDIIEDVKGKNIVVMDNASTTGISLIDATDLLMEKGAKNVISICLGLSEKEKEHDWNDLNKTLKYSKIINICKTPFVSKEKRELWKKTKS